MFRSWALNIHCMNISFKEINSKEQKGNNVNKTTKGICISFTYKHVKTNTP